MVGQQLNLILTVVDTSLYVLVSVFRAYSDMAMLQTRKSPASIVLS